MYAGGSLTEPQRSSRTNTNRSGTGHEFLDCHLTAEPEAPCPSQQNPIGMATADCFHSMSFVLFFLRCTYIRTYIQRFVSWWLTL